MVDVNSIQIIHNEIIAEIKEPSFYAAPDEVTLPNDEVLFQGFRYVDSNKGIRESIFRICRAWTYYSCPGSHIV